MYGSPWLTLFAPRFLGAPVNFDPSIPSMRKGRDGEKMGEKMEKNKKDDAYSGN